MLRSSCFSSTEVAAAVYLYSSAGHCCNIGRLPRDNRLRDRGPFHGQSIDGPIGIRSHCACPFPFS